MPIAIPMSADFSAGASLTPSPYGDDRPVRLQRVHDPQLVLGRHARVDGDVGHRRSQRVLVQRLELRSRQRERAGADDPQIAGDPERGPRMVSRDHHRAHARRGRLGDRRPDLGSRRVDDPDQPEVDQLVLDPLVRSRVGGQRPIGHGQGPQGEIRQPVDRLQHLGAAPGCQRAHRAGDAFGGAAPEQHVGRALGDGADRSRVLGVRLQRRHELALRGERELADALESRPPCVREAVDLGLGHEEGPLRRIALDPPFAVALAQGRVVGEAAGTDQGAHLFQQRALAQDLTVDARPAVGTVAAPGEVHLPGRRDHLLDRHLVLGQRAGLVRADDGGRSERLDGRQALDDRAAGRHPLDAEREHQREDRGQALGHRRDRQRHPDQQHVDQIRRLVDVGGQQDRGDDHDRDHDHDEAEHPPEMLDLALQGRLLGLGPAQQARDAAHLARHAGGGHHSHPSASRDGRPVEDHVDAVTQRRRLAERRHILEHRLALAGQRGLGDHQRCGLDQASVGADRIALGQQQDVSGNDLGGRDALRAPVSSHAGGRRGHPRQRRHGLVGARLLHEAQGRVESDDGQDDDRVVGHALRAFAGPRDERDDHGGQQQVDERVGELPEEPAPRGIRLLALELVGARALQPPRRLGGRQALLHVGPERCRHLGGVALPRRGHDRLLQQPRRGALITCCG
jgi:hypothetical protein